MKLEQSARPLGAAAAIMVKVAGDTSTVSLNLSV